MFDFSTHDVQEHITRIRFKRARRQEPCFLPTCTLIFNKRMLRSLLLLIAARPM